MGSNSINSNLNSFFTKVLQQGIADKNKDGVVSDKENAEYEALLGFSKDVSDLFTLTSEGNWEEALKIAEKTNITEKQELTLELSELDVNNDKKIDMSEIEDHELYSGLTNIFTDATTTFSMENFENYAKMLDINENNEIAIPEKNIFNTLVTTVKNGNVSGVQLTDENKANVLDALQQTVLGNELETRLVEAMSAFKNTAKIQYAKFEAENVNKEVLTLSTEEIQLTNLEKTTKSIEKYVARINDIFSPTNPQDPFYDGAFDFTDYVPEYDDQNRVTKLSSKYGTGVDITISYDENNNATVNCDNGRIFTLNSAGNIILFTQEGSNDSYSYEYDSAGKLVKTIHHQVSSDVVYSAFEYDAKGNMIKDGTGGIYENTYDSNGNLVSVKCGDDEIKYDSNGNIIKKVEAGKTLNYEYDANGVFVKAIDENGNEYDKSGRAIKYSEVKDGETFTREVKIAENGQKIISNVWGKEEGVIEIITDVNGYDMSQIVTLSDGTVVEFIFDSNNQGTSACVASGLNYGLLNSNIIGVNSRSPIRVISQTIKNPNRTIACSVTNPTLSKRIFSWDISINMLVNANLKFNSGENILINEDNLLSVTKTDGTKEIYEYNTKTRQFDLKKTILPVDLMYDINNDGVVDYVDYYDALTRRRVGYLTEEYRDYYFDYHEISDYVINAIQNDSSIDITSLQKIFECFDRFEDNPKIDFYPFLDCEWLWPYGDTKEVKKALLDKIDSNKEKNYDFNKDGKFNYDDLVTFLQAMVGEDSSYTYKNIKGIDLNGDGIITQDEKRALYGYHYEDEMFINEYLIPAFAEMLNNDTEHYEENIRKLEEEYETICDNINPDDESDPLAYSKFLLEELFYKL